jgi:hypothetical protein
MSGKRHRKAAKKRMGTKSLVAARTDADVRKPRPIRHASRMPWWKRHRFRQTLKLVGLGLAVFTPIATAVGFYVDIGDFRSHRAASRPPAADIVFFEKSNGEYRLIDPMNVVLDPTQDDIYNKRFAVPINLAVRNHEPARLEATRVEIYYPRDVKVRPAGKPKIDPRNRVLIYEHDLEDLQAVDNYTPLDTIDTLYFPFSTTYSTAIIVGPDLSLVELMTGIQKTPYPNGLELSVKIYARDRPPLNGLIRLMLGEQAGNPLPFGEFKETSPTIRESMLFQNLARQAQAAPNVWVAQDLEKSHLLMFRKIRSGGGTYRLLLIDRKVRRVYADVDSDGYLDFNLVDTTAPGSPDLVATPLAPVRAVDTPKPTGEGSVGTVRP